MENSPMNEEVRDIRRFSQLSKDDKLDSICESLLKDPWDKKNLIKSFWHPNPGIQSKFDELSENTISNFYVPYSVARNFLINGKEYTIPMAIEESSVVAAASKAAKFWKKWGGLTAHVKGMTKVGHIHFLWKGQENSKELSQLLLDNSILSTLRSDLFPITKNMENRGGGVLQFKIEPQGTYYQIKIFFDTKDSMGANFINTVLEAVSKYFEEIFPTKFFPIFSIVSNFTPECLVYVSAQAPMSEIPNVEKMFMAYEIASIDMYRAVTHNKGIMNGIDAVAIATGNDFRAIEACAHAYASKDGQYRSLSKMELDREKNLATISIEIPMAVGTVGGIGRIHSLANISLEMLGNPSAKDLMMIMASVGLAQNFAAISSLVTTGIQKGHMKMHLINILHQLGATGKEAIMAKEFFKDKTVSFSKVREYLHSIRTIQ